MRGAGDHAGAAIDFYFNPFLNGGMRIPIRIHPMVPPGTILGLCRPTAAAVPSRARCPMSLRVCGPGVTTTRVDWPVTTRAQMVGVYAEETLVVYAPFAMAAITNIAAG